MDTPWRIELFGGLRAAQGDQNVTRFRSQAMGLLLAYLAYYPQRAHPREELIVLLWPDVEPQAGRLRLRVALHALRQQFELLGASSGNVFLVDPFSIRLNPAVVTTDVTEFEAALRQASAVEGKARGEALRRAVDLYQGDLLPGFYTDWALTERERLAEAYREALGQLSEVMEQMQDLRQALEYARRAVSADPLEEEAHGVVMRLYAALGRSGEAKRQYQELERVLKAELGVAPSLEIRAFLEDLLRQPRPALLPRPPSPKTEEEEAQALLPTRPLTQRAEGGIRPQEAPALLPQTGRETKEETPSVHLPPLFTRFFGRQQEIAWLQARLVTAREGGARLITLIGTGGMGKTRLVIETARQAAEGFGGGVWFVGLASLAKADLIAGAIVDGLGLQRSSSADPLTQAERFLKGRGGSSLLVLDNYEHLVEEGAGVVKALLASCPLLTCLVTSRQALELEGEQEVAVLPLPTPGHANPEAPEQLLSYPSVALFVDRAQARRSDFQITTGNAGAVASLCERLEGIPLAIELAAAQARVWTPSQMLSQLERRLDFLVNRRRDAEARHRTLREAIEWSYRLLSPELQRFFYRLSVFRGGWTVEAAEAVCEEPFAQERLTQLCECSLVLAEEQEEGMRFRLLETLREFGQAQWTEAERVAVQQRHRDWFLALAEEAEPKLRGPEQKAWLDRLEREHDNLRTALAWSVMEDSDVETGWRLATTLAGFWEARGFYAEGRQWCDRLLSEPGEVSAFGRAQALWVGGDLAERAGDVQAARPLLEESLALFRALGDRPGIARALGSLGRAVVRQGDLSLGRSLLEESLALYRELGDKTGLAQALSDHSQFVQTDEARARLFLEESLALNREVGDIRAVAWALNALSRFEEAEALFRELEDRTGIADALVNRGCAALWRGEVERAAALFAKSLTLLREQTNERGITWALHWLASAAHAQGDFERAAALLEEALALLRKLGEKGLFRWWSLMHLGHIDILRGEMKRAKASLTESLLLFQQQGYKPGIGRCLAEFAEVDAAEGRMQRAARLFGVEEAFYEALDDREYGYHWPEARAEHEVFKTRARAALGAEVFAAAWAEGQAMTLEQAIAYALEETDASDREKKRKKGGKCP